MRIPLTAQAEVFTKAVDFGRRVIWLHTFGERFADAKAGRHPEPPRLMERAPRMPKDGAIPLDADSVCDEIEYDEAARRLGSQREIIYRTTWWLGQKLAAFDVPIAYLPPASDAPVVRRPGHRRDRT